MRAVKFINFIFPNRYSLLLLVLSVGFTNCGDDHVESPAINKPEPVIPAIAPTVCDFQLVEKNLTDSAWVKVFEDNFETDLSKWNIWTGGGFNGELQHYQALNITVDGGSLNITAKKETVVGANNPYDAALKTFGFTSGRIESKSKYSASTATPKVRFIARIKLPAGKGLWPAFWSYGDPWPTQGEIDFLEFRGSETTKYQTNYFYGPQANVNLVTKAETMIRTDANLTDCYHVYEMIWEKTKLTSILDGTIVEVKTSGNYIPQMFDKQQKIVLNLAVGGSFFQNLDPATIEAGAVMKVDWVKVFTSN